MKKIGIVTIYKVNNYGAELQAYATQKVLQLMGYDAEIINYPFYKNKEHHATNASIPVFKMPVKIHVAEFLYPKISAFRQFLQGLKSAGRFSFADRRKNSFNRFHDENTRFSPLYATVDELYQQDLGYDAYIVGSDQVWNPGVYSSLNPYFLKFAPEDKPRFSYASSIGLSKLPKQTHVYYKEAWQALNAISVREENAIGIIKSVSGRDAQWVLDPTLLLNKEEWMKVARKPADFGIEEFVLLYELTPCPYLKTLAKRIAAEKKAKIVRITKDAVRMEPDNDIINVIDAGPAEFLWLFVHTCFVVTNSFHGTAFSINMNHDFYVVTPKRKRNNSRQQSILSMFGLTCRLLLEDDPLPAVKQMEIDFIPVNRILEAQREKSKRFLRENIDGK